MKLYQELEDDECFTATFIVAEAYRLFTHPDILFDASSKQNFRMCMQSGRMVEWGMSLSRMGTTSSAGPGLAGTCLELPASPQLHHKWRHTSASERSRFPSWSKLGSASSSFAGRRFFCEVNPKQTTDKTDSKLLVLLLLQTTTGHKQVKAWM